MRGETTGLVGGERDTTPWLPGDLRVVIAHDFAEVYGGAERVIAEVADLFPEAPFWTILGRRSVARRMGVGDRFHSILPERPRLLRNYRWLAPLFPAIVRAVSLPAADVLVTSSYAFAHGFATRNRAPQVCYCHSPLRFAWSMTPSYGSQLRGGVATKQLFRAFSSLMRFVDLRSAQRVTQYVTDSDFTADQIERFYARPAEIVGAPVDCELFRPADEGHDDYYLFCGRLVEAYKRPSVVVKAFRSLPDRLLVAGDGPALPALRATAGSNVEFLGHLDDNDLVRVMQRCKAAIFPSRDDFGLIPVEVMACGRPVLAYGEGGALRTVRAGVTGEFFHSQTPEAVAAAVRAFDPKAYRPEAIRSHAEHWDRRRFRRAMLAAVERVVGHHDKP